MVAANLPKLVLVLHKIQALLEDKADFKMTRWLFDWDETKAPVENIPEAQQEHEALNWLRLNHVLELKVEGNFTRPEDSRFPRKFHNSDDYWIAEGIKAYDPESDKAWRNYDWCVWITKLELQKFITISRENGYDPKGEGVNARLELENMTTPKIIVNGVEYKFKPLRYDQSPGKILHYCLANKPGVWVKLEDLKEPLKLNDVANLKKVFQGTDFSPKRGALQDFMMLQPKIIKVVPNRFISSETYRQIKNTATGTAAKKSI